MGANKKISELPASSTLDGSEVFPIVQAGETRRANISELISLSAGLTSWSSAITYNAGDSVLRAGLLWLATGTSTNEDPGSGSHWALQVTNGAPYSSAWASSPLGAIQATVYAKIESLSSIYELLDGSNTPWTGNHGAGGFNLINIGALGIGCAPSHPLDVEVSGDCIAYFKSTSGNDVSILMQSSGSFVGGFAYDSGAGFTSFYGPGSGTSAIDILSSMEVRVRSSLTAGSDIEITDKTKGVIMTDRTSDTRYRIYIDGTAIQLELA